MLMRQCCLTLKASYSSSPSSSFVHVGKKKVGRRLISGFCWHPRELKPRDALGDGTKVPVGK